MKCTISFEILSEAEAPRAGQVILYLNPWKLTGDAPMEFPESIGEGDRSELRERICAYRDEIVTKSYWPPGGGPSPGSGHVPSVQRVDLGRTYDLK